MRRFFQRLGGADGAQLVPRVGNNVPLRADEMGESLEAYLMSHVRGDVKSSSVTAAESGGLMVVTLRAACEENIAELREYTPVQDAP